MCQALCGRDARAPRWSCAGETPALPGGAFNRLHCLHRLIGEGCQRNERCEKSLQCARSAMEADGLIVHQLTIRRIAHPWFPYQRQTLFLERIAYMDRLPWLDIPLGARASRPHPYSCISLPSTATPSQRAPNPPLRGSLPSCQGLCGRDARVPGGCLCGRDARVPRWSCAGGTPALPGGLFCRHHPKRGSRSRSWCRLGASRSLADRMGCRMGHSIPISGSSQRMAIWSSPS